MVKTKRGGIEMTELRTLKDLEEDVYNVNMVETWKLKAELKKLQKYYEDYEKRHEVNMDWKKVYERFLEIEKDSEDKK